VRDRICTVRIRVTTKAADEPRSKERDMTNTIGRIVAGVLLSSGVAVTGLSSVAGATPSIATGTRQPCDLLTPAVAKKYVGDNAQRQLTLLFPQRQVGDDTCYYTGDTRSVGVAIFPVPTDPTAPINHFGVIQPRNRIAGLSFDAYWFGPDESLVAVRDGLVISMSVETSHAGTWTDQDRSDDLDLANTIVPQVS
jgi:hypothetical protein